MCDDVVLVKIDDGFYTSFGGVWTVSQESRVEGTGWWISGMNWFRVNCGPHKSVAAAAKAIEKYDLYAECGARVFVRKAKGDNRITCPFCGAAMEHKSHTIDGVCWAFMACTNRRHCLHETQARLVSTPVPSYRDRFSRFGLPYGEW